MIELSEYVNEHFVNGTNKTQIKEVIDDGYFYTREIGDEKQKHTKILMGNHLFYSHNIDEKLIQKFKELANEYEVEDKELNHI